MLYSLARSALFQLPTETSHDLSMKAIDLMATAKVSPCLYPKVRAPKQVMGIEFPNSVGLAAGLDKNGDHILGMDALGFGFVEIGTVTPRAQDGNPLPRLFRLPQQQAIINRMGFNNKGVDHLVSQVVKSRFKGVLGINIGKNLTTPVEKAEDDYLYCLERVYPHATYIVVNVSSPNTPGLRTLQFGDSLAQLLSALKDKHSQLATEHGVRIPLVIKIAPDLADEEIEMIAKQFLEFEIDGVIATNTTAGRTGVEQNPLAKEAGGLSGAPLCSLSTQVIGKLHTALDGQIPIIGVGGISSAADARAKIAAGASLVQIYSGFIYQGPGLIRRAAKALA